MDPASAIGLVGAIVGIADVIVKSVNSLRHFQSSYQGADVRVGALVSQLLAVKAALGNVSDMISSDWEGGHIAESRLFSRQFCEDLRVSLYGCEAMVCALDSQLVNLRRNENNGLTTASRFHMAMQDSAIDGYLMMLNNQTSALQLLLTSLQCRTSLGGKNMLQEPSGRQIIKQVQDSTSSLLWLYDEQSVLSLQRQDSAAHQDLSTISTQFSFDSDLITSRVYKTAMRSHMILAIGVGSGGSVRSQGNETTPSALRITERFSIHSSRLSIAQTGGDENEASDVATIKNMADGDSLSSRRPQRRFSPRLKSVSSVSGQGRNQRNEPQTEVSRAPSMRTGGESLERFWHQRSQFGTTSLPPVLQCLPPASAPEDAINVMVLGRPGAGKTTLIKSLLYVLGCLDVQTRISYVESIHQEALETVQQLGDMLPGADWTEPMLSGAIVSEAMAKACAAFCSEPAFRQKVADGRREGRLVRLPQSAEYFLNALHRLNMPNYIPSARDILRSYQKTLGNTVTNFKVNGTSYNFFDTSERKWSYITRNMDFLIFNFDIAYGCDRIQFPGDSTIAITEQEETRLIHEMILQQHEMLEFALKQWQFANIKVIILFTKIDKLTPSFLQRLSATLLFNNYYGPKRVDEMLNHLARYLASGLPRTSRKAVFCKASIAELSTEIADVVMSALEHFDEQSSEKDDATIDLRMPASDLSLARDRFREERLRMSSSESSLAQNRLREERPRMSSSSLARDRGRDEALPVAIPIKWL